MALQRRRGVDIVSGPLMKNIFFFAVPIILSGVLQMLFNAADTAVVGRFGSSTALASVGSTGSLTNLIVNTFMGLSTGAGVAVAQAVGAGKRDEVRETIRTSVTLSLICGVIVALIGILGCPYFLRWMGSPADVIGGSTLYMRVYFAGMPAIMLYNYGAAILRSMGDTKRPLYFLTSAGVVNVLLNLLFVIGMHLDVVGVALATVLSQCGAAVLVVMCLLNMPPDIRLELRNLGLRKACLGKIIRIGLPAGLQGVLFSFSNVIMQSSVNSFGSATISANAAAYNLENVIYIALNGVAQSATTFSGQNYGARNIARVRKTALDAALLVTAMGGILGLSMCLGTRQLMHIFTTDAAVIEIGVSRMFFTTTMYFFCGLMDVFSGTLRGMGRSFIPMLVSVFGVCGIRISWIFFIFPIERTLDVLYLSYPLSWCVTACFHLLFCIIVLHKERKNVCSDLPGLPGEA